MEGQNQQYNVNGHQQPFINNQLFLGNNLVDHDSAAQNHDEENKQQQSVQQPVAEMLPTTTKILIDFRKQKVANSFTFMDMEMEDSDCSEEYDTDDFY